MSQSKKKKKAHAAPLILDPDASYKATIAAITSFIKNCHHGALPGGSFGPLIPRSARDEIAEASTHFRSVHGITKREFANDIGIPKATFYSWSERAPGVPPPAKTHKRSAATQPPETNNITVHLANGLRISGLTLTQLRELIRERS